MFAMSCLLSDPCMVGLLTSQGAVIYYQRGGLRIYCQDAEKKLHRP